MERNKTIDIVISVIIAIVLWFYVINIVNPPTSANYRRIPVAITGDETLADRGLAIAGKTDYTVDVKISGTRKDISGLTTADITATADIASLAQGNTYIVVSVDVPRNFTVDQITDENIEVRVEDLVTEQKKVTMIPKDAGDGLETTVLSLGAESVAVKGAKSDVAKVYSVRTEISPDILEVDKIKTVSVKGVPYDLEGNVVDCVSLVQESIDYEAGIFHTKIVQLSIPIIGESLYGAEGIEKIEAPTAITIKGTEADLANVNVIKTEPVDITGLAENKIFNLTAIIPDGIYPSKTVGELKASAKISEEAKAAYEAAQAEEQTESPAAIESAN